MCWYQGTDTSCDAIDSFPLNWVPEVCSHGVSWPSAALRPPNFSARSQFSRNDPNKFEFCVSYFSCSRIFLLSSRFAFLKCIYLFIYFLRHTHAVASLWRATTLADMPFISGLPSISPRYSDYIYSARLCCAPTCVSHRNPFDNEDMDVILSNLSKKNKKKISPLENLG